MLPRLPSLASILLQQLICDDLKYTKASLYALYKTPYTCKNHHHHKLYCIMKWIYKEKTGKQVSSLLGLYTKKKHEKEEEREEKVYRFTHKTEKKEKRLNWKGFEWKFLFFGVFSKERKRKEMKVQLFTCTLMNFFITGWTWSCLCFTWILLFLKRNIFGT